MATGTQAYDGTEGNYVSAATGGITTFTLDTDPNGNNTDVALSASLGITSSMSAKILPAATLVTDQFAGSHTGTVYWRRYYYLTAAPSNSFAIAMRTNVAWSSWQYVGITTDRRLFINGYDTNFNTNYNAGVQSSANAVPLNEWVRIEGIWTPGSAPTVRMYTTSGAGITSTGTPDTSLTLGSNTDLGTAGGMWYGAWSYSTSFSNRTFISSGQNIYMDAGAWDDTGYPSPVGSPSGPLSLPSGGRSYAGLVPV